MNKRRTKLLACLFTAGMLSLATFVGVNSNPITKTEITTYQMKENQAAVVTDSREKGRIKDQKYISDFISALPKGYGYTRVKLNALGYDKDVLLVALPGEVYGDHAYHIFLFTEKSGRNLKCIAELDSHSSCPFEISNGFLYVRTFADDKENLLEEFTMSADGERLIPTSLSSYEPPYGGYIYNPLEGYKLVDGKFYFDRLFNKFHSAKVITFKIK